MIHLNCLFPTAGRLSSIVQTSNHLSNVSLDNRRAVWTTTEQFVATQRHRDLRLLHRCGWNSEIIWDDWIDLCALLERYREEHQRILGIGIYLLDVNSFFHHLIRFHVETANSAILWSWIRSYIFINIKKPVNTIRLCKIHLVESKHKACTDKYSPRCYLNN
jgi:hypothetical protein